MASKSSHVRTNSLPSRSHPTTLRVEEELNKIKIFEPSYISSESICNDFCRLAELYQCMDDLLNLPSTIQALSQQLNQRLGEEFLDGSLRILDICGIVREIVSQFKENVRDLQSSLRRRKGDSTIESSLNNYTCMRKKMKKEAKKSISALKQIDQGINGMLDLDDEHVAAVIKVLREANSTSIAIFESVLTFLSAQSSKPKSNKWSLVSRLVHKGKVGCEGQQESQNELENVDSALQNLCRNDQSEIEKIQNRLETLAASIDGIENGLEGLFRCMIRSRASLLNIVSY